VFYSSLFAAQDIDSGSLTAVLATNRRLNVPPAAVLTLNLLVVFAVLITFPIHLYPALQVMCFVLICVLFDIYTYSDRLLFL
jgi:uncharacterized membrane protein